MKKSYIYLTTALTLLSMLICGAWTSPTAAYADTPKRYVDAQLISTYSEEVIDYDSREIVEDISTPNGVPLYYGAADMTNCCGPIGGTIAVGYYDKYYSNMIPDWDSYYPNGKYRTMVSQYVDPVMWDIYDRMKTNVVGPGVSEQEFKDGLESYIKSKGHNITYPAVKSGSSFNYTTYKNALQDKKPVVLFVSPSDLYFVSEADGYDRITTSAISGDHVMIAYGYREIRYTIGSTVRTDTYLLVATGFMTIRQAYYKVSSLIDSAYVLNVT